jgi:hypothetical protein
MVGVLDTCPECGNHDMRVRVVDGLSVHECGLCEARFGDRRALTSLADAEEARLHGVDRVVWPLVRALRVLPGLCVRKSVGGDLDARTLPFVELGATSPEALHQLENLAKSLRLSAGALRLHWIVEVEYQHHLAFVLKPRHPGGAVSLGEARDARIDLDVLGKHLARDTQLAWWRHAAETAHGTARPAGGGQGPGGASVGGHGGGHAGGSRNG